MINASKKGKNKKRYGLLIAVGILILISFLTIQVIQIQKKATLEEMTQHPEEFLQIPWKTYIDPQGYYSISIPSNWPVDQGKPDIGHDEWSVGNVHHYVVSQNYGASFGIARKKGSYYISVDVIYRKPVEGTCRGTPNTTLSGFPAEQDAAINYWYIDTNLAAYSIMGLYTGNGGGSMSIDDISPQTMQSYGNAAQKVIDKVITSVKFPNQKPFQCHKENYFGDPSSFPTETPTTAPTLTINITPTPTPTRIPTSTVTVTLPATPTVTPTLTSTPHKVY